MLLDEVQDHQRNGDRSDRSTTTSHIVLDLRSLIWGVGESCSIVRGFTQFCSSLFSSISDQLTSI